MSTQPISEESEVTPEIGGAAEVADALRRHQRILIVTHVRPDGDCLGSATTMLAALQGLGKKVWAYNPSPIPDKLLFLPRVNDIKDTMPDWVPDLTLFLDCGGPDRVTPNFTWTGYCINVDHHSTNEMFGDLNWVDSNYCAVGEQVFHLVNELRVEITPEMASCMYASIASDTGSFKYSNTNSATFRLAAELVDAGANPSEICKELFESRKREEIVLTGKAYSRLRFESKGRLAWSEILWADYAEFGGDDVEPDGLVGDLRAISGVEISILFHELENGCIRAGLRGKGAINCALLASRFGGGGHVNAAGFFNDKAKFAEERDRIVQAAIKMIEEAMD